MYNIDLYTYKDKPIINEDKVKIFPLNDQGITKYLLNKESHVCTYLDIIKQNPSLLNEQTSPPNDILPSPPVQIIPPIPNPSPSSKPHPSNLAPQSSRNCNSLFKKKLLSNSMDMSRSKNDYYTNLFYSRKQDSSENTNDFFKKVHHSIITSRKRENKTSMHNDMQSQFGDVVSPLHLKLNKYFKNFHKKMTFKDIYGYAYPLNEKSRGNICNNEMSFLKEEMSSIGKRKGLRKARSFIVDEKEEKVLKKKNWEMKRKLMQQMDKEFLKRNKLPDIRLIANGADVVRKVKDGFCKELGEKYDPFAFVVEKPQIKGRNYFGGMFKN